MSLIIFTTTASHSIPFTDHTAIATMSHLSTTEEVMKKPNNSRKIDGHKLFNLIQTSLQPRPRLRF